jgi:hypothetical protein
MARDESNKIGHGTGKQELYNKSLGTGKVPMQCRKTAEKIRPQISCHVFNIYDRNDDIKT